ncbi:MAG: hypothetical protein AAF570_04930 [Bacteroidota bacterium]
MASAYRQLLWELLAAGRLFRRSSKGGKWDEVARPPEPVKGSSAESARFRLRRKDGFSVRWAVFVRRTLCLYIPKIWRDFFGEGNREEVNGTKWLDYRSSA